MPLTVYIDHIENL